MNKTINCLIDIMAAALDARPLNTDFEGVDFHTLLRLADFHRIDIPMYYALQGAKGVPEKLSNELKHRHEINSFKFAVTDAETEYLNSEFEKAGIPYMLLKGSVIREFYSHPDMRTSCDVDYLIKDEHAKKTEEIMLKSGYDFTTHTQGVDSYKKPPFTSIEIHYELMGGHEEFDCLKSLWENSVSLGVGEQGRKMCHDDFYIYTIVHIAKHLTGGGSGIRPIMDMYIYLKNFEKILDFDYINKTLATVGLDTLAHELRILCEYWFCDGEPDDVTHTLSGYVVESGIFGTRSNAEAQREVYKNSGAKIAKRRNRLKSVFISYKNMTLRYPSLKTPILLPVYWVIRAFDVLFNKSEKIPMLIKKNLTEVSPEKVEKIQELFTRLGIIKGCD